MRQLLDQLSFQDDVDPDDACELIQVVSDHFRKKLAEDMTNADKINDDNYWIAFLKRKTTRKHQLDGRIYEEVYS